MEACASGTPLLLRPMQGLGDTAYQRPFIRAQAELRPVYLRTAWPEMFADLPDVHLVEPPAMPWRTQQKNLKRHTKWMELPAQYESWFFTYTVRKPGRTILQELETYVGLGGRPFIFDLPDFGPSPICSEKPVAVLRPVTIRAEWLNPARAPRPEYIAQAARILRNTGFHVVAVADLEPGKEWLEGAMPEADEYFLHGELNAHELLATMQHAAVVVGGVGFIVPVAVAQKTPLVVISGGMGAHNAPEIITDPRMGLTRTRFVLPDAYCRCNDSKHDCPKYISDFPARFANALAEVAP